MESMEHDGQQDSDDLAMATAMNLSDEEAVEEGGLDEASGGMEVEEEYTMPRRENGRYRNPWKTWRKPKLANVFKLIFCTKDESNIPKKVELDKNLPVLKPDLSEFDVCPTSGIRHMWIGHATSVLQFDGVTILTDPMFSERCSPVQFLGMKRYRPTPCSVEELPHVDCVVISHTHYDHLDYGSVVALNQRFGKDLRWYVPMGLKQWLNDCHCENVVEMMWWQEDMFNEETNVKFVCTPCQHWGKRTASDENKVLWCSWCVIGPKHSFHFSGDTAYCEGFKQIGKRYGPFTLATIPIGAYSPRNVMANMHTDPENAVNIHEDILSQASIGIHWGTFAMAYEPYMEPKELLQAEVEKRKMKPSSFFTVKHGEILLVGTDSFDKVD